MIILTLLSGLTCYIHFDNGFALSVNNLLAFICLIIAFAFKLFKVRKLPYLIFFILIFSSIDFLAYVPQFSREDTSGTGLLSFQPPGFNPVCILMLILYWLVNFNSIRNSFWALFDKRRHRDIMIEFYRDQFFNLPPDELEEALNIYDKYPEEAQFALREIHQKRKLNIRQF